MKSLLCGWLLLFFGLVVQCSCQENGTLPPVLNMLNQSVIPTTLAQETTTPKEITTTTSTTPATTSSSSTTIAPPVNTTITTTSSSTSTSTTPSPNPTPTPTPTTSTTTPATPVPCHHFDGPSFIGGIVLTLGLLAIGIVASKFYRAHNERGFQIL